MKLKSMTMNFMFAKWQTTRLFSRLSLLSHTSFHWWLLLHWDLHIHATERQFQRYARKSRNFPLLFCQSIYSNVLSIEKKFILPTIKWHKMPIAFANIAHSIWHTYGIVRQRKGAWDRQHICYISNCSIIYFLSATFKCTHFSLSAALMNMSHTMSNSHYKSHKFQ